MMGAPAGRAAPATSCQQILLIDRAGSDFRARFVFGLNSGRARQTGLRGTLRRAIEEVAEAI
ncbi:hypothetical protein SE92_04265 [Bradyrhizobium sp. AT1]|nr:hypothetical protein SE92_04265 [Bradyrhizobium sp. AT1]